MEKNNNKNVFATNLNNLMVAQNKSRKDLSDALGISYFTITAWVNGTKYPRMDKVEMLANYFGVLKSDLIEEKERKSTEEEGLSEQKKALIQFANMVPEDKVELVLRVMRTIAEAD